MLLKESFDIQGAKFMHPKDTSHSGEFVVVAQNGGCMLLHLAFQVCYSGQAGKKKFKFKNFYI